MTWARLHRSPTAPRFTPPKHGYQVGRQTQSSAVIPREPPRLSPALQRMPVPGPPTAQASTSYTQPKSPGTSEAPEQDLTAVTQPRVTVDPFALSSNAESGYSPDALARLRSSLSGSPPCGPTGPAGFHAPIGRTDFQLNSHAVTSADDVAQHLALPTLRQTHVLGQTPFFSIDRLPVNRVTGQVRVPSAPSTWSPFYVPPNTLRVQLQSHGFPESFGLRMCAINAPSTRQFEVKVADPSALIRDMTAHERVHESDIAAIVTTVIGAWSEGLGQMHQAKVSVQASDHIAAAPLLYAELRRRIGGPGDPCEVGEAIEQGVVDAANALHQSPGGNIRVQDFRVNWPFCERVTVDWGIYPGTPTSCGPATPDLGCQPTPPLQVTA